MGGEKQGAFDKLGRTEDKVLDETHTNKSKVFSMIDKVKDVGGEVGKGIVQPSKYKTEIKLGAKPTMTLREREQAGLSFEDKEKIKPGNFGQPKPG